MTPNYARSSSTQTLHIYVAFMRLCVINNYFTKCIQAKFCRELLDRGKYSLATFLRKYVHCRISMNCDSDCMTTNKPAP